ncbi:hypothetical protein [Scytonema sp. NUACC21]
MNWNNLEDTTIYKVVVNDEQQYLPLCLNDKSLPGHDISVETER